MAMTVISAVVALGCAVIAVYQAMQRHRLKMQLTATYDALSNQERENTALLEQLETAQAQKKAALVEAEEMQVRAQAVQNALREVQNLWNYTGSDHGQQEVG
mgnify:CR=1 FL=1